MKGNRLREVRLQRGLTQLELAIRTRIAPQDLSAIECGRKWPFPSWRRRLAKALGVEEDYLFPECHNGGGEA